MLKISSSLFTPCYQSIFIMNIWLPLLYHIKMCIFNIGERNIQRYGLFKSNVLNICSVVKLDDVNMNS